MIIYLDNCCFNRPFDDQTQLRIKIEAESKLKIQDEIRAGRIQLAWSYILDLENNNNPYAERKYQIREWKRLAAKNIDETPEVIDKANSLLRKGMRNLDSLHIACAICLQCEFFITTDDKVLKRNDLVEEIEIIDPFGFVKEVEL